jgi:hypothetical protein
MRRARPAIVCGVLPITRTAKTLRAELQITVSQRDYAAEFGN